MLISVTFEFLSLFFILVIYASFAIRRKDDTEEVSLFWKLIVINIIGLIVETISLFSLMYYKIMPNITELFCRLDMILISLNLYIIYLFTCVLFNPKMSNNNRKGILNSFVFILFIASLVVAIMLPIEFHTEFIRGRYTVSYVGQVVDTFIVILGTIMTICVINLIMNRKYYFRQRLVIISFYIFLAVCVLIGHVVYIGFTFEFSGITFVTVLVYFLIENYDVKKVYELQEVSKKVDKLNGEKNKFLFNMSHEIRTNLNTIVVTSNLLMDNKLDKKTKDDLKEVVFASDSLLEIVGNIIDINKIEKDTDNVKEEIYDLRKEIEGLSEMNIIRIEDKPINYMINIDEDLPKLLFGYKSHVKKIINNLISNAFKYTNEGSVSLNLKCDNDLKKKISHITISVVDTGIGIKDTSRLFNKFDRLDLDKASTIEGTGLGLVITKRFIESLGGTINVDSVVGKGSTFTVTFDQKIGDEKDLIHDDISMDKIFGGMKILLVDDDELNLNVLKKVFTKYNCYIDSTSSGREAISMITREKYDLVFTDVFMPDMDGFEVLKTCKKYDIPVVALTADALQDSEEKYLTKGFNGYISKPYSQKDIYMAMDEFLYKE